MGSENGVSSVFGFDSYGNIDNETYYDGSTIIMQRDVYYASYKLLLDFEDVDNWAETGDGALSDISGGFEDGTDCLRNTYTYATGSSIVADTATNHGDLSSYVGAACTTGYVTVFLKFSDYSNVTSVACRIGSASNAYRSVSCTQLSWYNANSKWFPLEFDLSAGSSTGSPDGTGIDYLALVFTIAAGTSQTVDMRCIMVNKEATTLIAGNTFYDLRREVTQWTSESKTETKIYHYEENNNICAYKLTGGY